MKGQMLRYFSILFLGAVISANFVDLCPAQELGLGRLVKESSLIVTAQARRLGLSNTSGHAVMRIGQVLKGEIKREELEVRWFFGEGDVPIEFLRVRYLLFLKNDNPHSDIYYAAMPGRSYWPLLRVEDDNLKSRCSAVVPLSAPAEDMLFPEAISWREVSVYLPFFPSKRSLIAIKGICFEDLEHELQRINSALRP